jgi:hypothetical protein
MSKGTKLVVVSDGRALLPRDPYSAEVVASMPRGQDAMAEIRQPRSLKQLRFLYAMARKIADNHAIYTTVPAVIYQLKIRSGMFEPIIAADTMQPSKSKIYYTVKSTAFESMDAVEFGQIFDQWRRIIREELLPGVSDEGLVREIMETL